MIDESERLLDSDYKEGIRLLTKSNELYKPNQYGSSQGKLRNIGLHFRMHKGRGDYLQGYFNWPHPDPPEEDIIRTAEEVSGIF